MQFFRSLSIRNKLLVVILPVILVCFVVLGQVVSVKIRNTLRAETVRQLQATITSLDNMVTIANEATIRDADGKARNFSQAYPGTFTLDTGKTVRIGSQETPVLRHDGAVVNLNFSQVDHFSHENDNSVATVFARAGDDFVRIATSLKKEDGSRAVGTYLGSSHPAHAKLLQGGTYHSKAKLFGHYYMTKYIPIKDPRGSVIGVLFVGTNIDPVIEKLEKTIAAIRVGATGYAYVLDNGLTATRGEYIFHPDRNNVGTNFLAFKDAEGKEFIKEMLDKREGYVNYWWKNGDETKAREKFAVFANNGAWGWLIAGSGYTEELYAAARSIQGYILAGSLLCSLLLGVVIMAALRKFLAPLHDTAEILERIAEGDLTVVPKVESSDEIGTIQLACCRMVERLSQILRKTADNAAQVAAAASQMSSTADQIAVGAEEVSCQVITVATASEEMSATSSEIAQNCLSAADLSRESTDSAQRGAAVVRETVVGMHRIAERVKGTAGTIESLGSRSDQIGTIVGTIEEIADQTNLLALNAAIEAARAGESGRGFAVVADAVRALAEKTTRATKEIGAMIKAIQLDTQGAVASMEEGVREVERGTEGAARSGEALQEIIDQIGNLSLQIDLVATAAEQQNATTTEIASNILQVTDVIQHTTRGAEESAAAARDLARLAEDLQRLVSQFRMAA
jgi:methyl-accepting chemotaxis protein